MLIAECLRRRSYRPSIQVMTAVLADQLVLQVREECSAMALTLL